MSTVRLAGNIDENHQLSASVPDSISACPVTILIIPPSQEDEAGDAWATGVSQQWADELGDSRQDIYTLSNGEPAGEA